MNYALDFFEISAQYLSIVMVGMVRSAATETMPAGAVAVINKIDTKRPLSFGDWANDILPKAVAAARECLPDEPLTVAMTAVAGPKRNLWLGSKREKSLVQIRNEYKGHGTTLAESIYEEVVGMIEERVEELAAAIVVLEQYPERPDKSHFYIGTVAHGEVDVYPLIHHNEKGQPYVFQSLKDEEVSFISSDEHAVTRITDAFNAELDRWAQAIVPSFDISKEQNWAELRQVMADYSQEYLHHMYSEKKYNQELFVERDQLSAIFRSFRESDDRLLPLLGEAGQGKTTQLCHWTEQLMQSDDAVVTFASSEFAEGRLEQRLRELFGLSYKKDIHRFLASLNDKAVQAGRQVCFLFDAINEVLAYPGAEGSSPLALYRDIYALFGKHELTAFRVLFTCRNYTWQNELRPEQKQQDMTLFSRLGEEATVRSFTDEEISRAYTIYQDLYQMQTLYGQIERKNIIRIKNPLILKIVCTNYLGHNLPEDNSRYTSLALFDKMIDDISHSYAGGKQTAILRELTAVILRSYEAGVAQDSILLEDLRQARFAEEAPLYKTANLVYNDKGTTIAFEELLNKPERPILRLIKDEKIQFIYERFLEYMLARAYFERERARVAEGTPIPAEVYVETMQHAAVNEVFMSTLRNVLIMDYMHTSDPQTIIRLASEYSDNFSIVTLIADVLNSLVTENYEAQLFPLLQVLLTYTEADRRETIDEYNRIWKIIEKNKADDETIARYKELSALITPMMNRKRLATGTLVNGVFMTDYHNEQLYTYDPYALLDLVMEDTITEIRDNACLLIYYASHKTHTAGYTPLRENITRQIVKRMYGYINRSPLITLVNGKRRKRIVTYLETGTRINILMIIDRVLAGDAQQDGDNGIQISTIFDDITSVAKHLTANFTLFRVLLPFVQLIMRRQVLFQSDYVNNVIEYQTFWEDNVIPQDGGADRWGRNDLAAIAPFAYLYSKRGQADAPTNAQWQEWIPKILSAYQTGDSLSYFAMERLLIIAGMADYENVAPIVRALRGGSNRDTEWFDYSQMSFIYVLYQLGLKMPELPQEVEEMLSEWCVDWTLRCRGWFRGRNSYKANQMQLYKRNVMTWYAMVYCVRHGDNRDPEQQSVPYFRQLIDRAIATRDKELLVHLLNNISELVTDSGYIYTSLDLLESVMRQIPSQQVLDELEINVNLRYPDTKESIITLIGKTLGTAKNYFPQQVNAFLTKDIINLTFPGIDKYKDDILGYNPGGERLSDLFTHKFGNALIYTLIHEQAIDDVVVGALQAAGRTNGSYQWFEEVVKIVFNKMFNLRL
ncbi:MAG: NACHT domain-containing protein, partial [Paludibacteraceae bacterium]|nr:NACHT domain-containing protein [Paludibacteraceae bacterium]